MLIENSGMIDEGRGRPAPVRLARKIAQDIIEHEIPVGTHLGALPEVAGRHGVSVPTLRKAITYLLDDGFVLSREGRGGGLVVAAPPQQTALRSMHLFLDGLGPTAEHISETRDVIDVALAERACRLVDEDDQRRMEELFAEVRNPLAETSQTITAFDNAIVAAAKQPVLALVSAVLDKLECDRTERGLPDPVEELALRRETVRAIVGGNLADAINLRRRLRPMTGQAEVEEMPAARLSQLVWDSIHEIVRQRQLSPGDEIGHERDLQSRFGVGRSTLRDALRPLERSGVVKIMPGRGGGIFVGSAEPYEAAEMASLYLSSIKLTIQDQIESRQILEARAAWLAAERITPSVRDRLQKAMKADEKAARTDIHDWTAKGAEVERLIARACGNPLLEFFTLALIDLSLLQGRKQALINNANYPDLVHLVSRHHGEIVQAIVAGQPAKAAFKTRRYVQELGQWMG